MRGSHLRRTRGERGAFLVIFALCITVLVLIMALVIDLAFTRADRRGGQVAVDNGVMSAAQTLARSQDAELACLDAFSIVAATLDIGTFVGQDCSSLPPMCAAGTSEALVASLATEGTSAGYVLTVTYPVDDDAGILDGTSTIGNEGIGAGDDGDRCERLGLRIVATGDSFFGGIAGSSDRTTSVYAVARLKGGTTEERPLNLLALERYSCDVFVISGQGDVVVKPMRDSENRFVPGVAAVDSDGTESCQNNGATLRTAGQGDLVANGPCEDDAESECSGEGRIPVLAPFSDGSCDGTDDAPGCRQGSNGEITPNVEASPGRFTRAPIDYRYNCKSSYASEPWYSGVLRQPIPGCTQASSTRPYIDELKAYVASVQSLGAAERLVAGWQTPLSGNNCTVPDGTVYVGNVYFDCDRVTADGRVRFLGGNAIFRGELRIASSTSHVTMHEPCPTPAPLTAPLCAPALSWSAGANLNEGQSSALAGWISVGSNLTVSSGRLDGLFATVLFPHSSGRLNVTGGDFRWEAPDGVGPFDDLAVWSEGVTTSQAHSLGGSGTINVVGTLFTGQATFDYAGGTEQTMDEAQFVANRLRFTGQGALSLKAAPDRNVEFPLDPSFNLIR